jgi:hypothetical protein
MIVRIPMSRWVYLMTVSSVSRSYHTNESLVDAFEEYFDCKFVRIDRGSKEAVLKFSKEEQATMFLLKWT